jgi:heme b synthase
VLDQISDVGKPIIILTGGEPLLREDIFTLAAYGTQKGLRMVMGTNGTLITPAMVKEMRASGIKRISISLDGATERSHDTFRKVEGAFGSALQGITYLKEQGVEFQINTTITRSNLSDLEAIMDLAANLGAVAHHIFLLVPTGRAKDMVSQELNAQEYEDTLRWFYYQQQKYPLQLKATCAPQYYRIASQESGSRNRKAHGRRSEFDAITRGCLAGLSYCFISHEGIVQPCGYLELNSGDLRKSTFADIWRHSPTFVSLRDFSGYKGKCGRCEYITICGGCRARAYEATGDFLAEEPLCAYKEER